jgi:YD repeat-containing protein
MTSRNSFYTPLLLAAVFLTTNPSQAQDTTNTIGNVSIASPTAASLGKYGDIPVSYNTGIPNISIPIYTIKAGSLSLPITLNYHASGLKVEEEASWVGAGWSLNAGGVITRTVIGAADDQGLQSANVCTNGYYSDYGYNSYLFVTNPYGPGEPGTAFDGTWTDDLNFQWGIKDGEPDLYFFNFGGYSGKFYFNDDRTPIFVPEEDFKVQPDLNNGIGSYGFQGFVVTTPDGVKYYFGMTGNDNTAIRPIEISTPANTQTGPAYSNTAVSSWFLNKIISADGTDSITFTYAQEQFSEYSLAMYPISTLSGNINPASGGYGLVKTFIKGVRLATINFPNGQVTFTPSPSPRSDLDGYNPMVFTGQSNTVNSNNLYPSFSLGSIGISNTSGFCKKDSFYYGYFQDNINNLNGLLSGYSGYNIHSDTYRLCLDSVQETSCDGTVSVPPYKFSYYSELVPRKLSFGLDHWGFYNGVTTNQCLIPTYSETSSAGVPVQTYAGATRDASWPAMRGGALNKITYPTGGYTNLTFEPNTTWINATNYVPTNRVNACASCSGQAVPDTVPLTSVGNSYQFIMENQLPGSNGVVEVFPVGSYTSIYTGPPVAVGQTDTSYAIIPSGNYNVISYKNTVTTAGSNFTVSVNEEIPVSYTGNDTVGGLRIKSVVNYDGISPDSVVTNYSYNSEWGGTQSSGILYSRPVYCQNIRNDVYGWLVGPILNNSGCNSIDAIAYFLSPTSISPLSTVQGNHIGYNEVDVSQPGNGHTTYRYYGSAYWDYIISDVCTRNINMAAVCNTTIPNWPAPPQPFEPMRGELQYVGQFNQAGLLLKEANYTPVYLYDSLTTPGRMYAAVTGGWRIFSSYTLQSARKVQTTTVTTTVDPNGTNQVNQTSTVYYGSLYHHQPTRQVTTTSTGDSLATNTVYSMDLAVPQWSLIPDSLPYFINVYDADSVTFFTDVGIPAVSNYEARMDTFANMERHVNLAHLQYLNYRLRSFSGDSSLQASYHATAESSADTALEPIYRMQDEFEITPIEITQWRDNKLLHATFNKYDTSIIPVGVVYPDRTQLVNLQAPSGTFTNAYIFGNTLIKDSRYADESLYQFSSGNPQQVSPHDGVTVSYIWDYQNQEPIAKAVGTTANQIAYTSFEANGGGGWTIAGNTMNTNTAVTGNQCYYLPSGAVSKTGLNTGQTYIVSYWTNNSTSYTIPGTTLVTQGKTATLESSNWTYFEHTITGESSITVSGPGYIDELRLYPQGAQMTTYSYTPMVGMTSQCDVDNRVTYYAYDALGRLRYIKDQDGNIIKTIEYHYSLSQTGGGGY